MIKAKIDGLPGVFWEGTREHKLLLQRCLHCGKYWHPPAPICPHCGSFDFQWQASCGRGTIYTYTIVHHSVHPLVTPWIPYNIVLVDLDEGPRVISTIRDCPADKLAVGLKVEVAYEDLADDFTLPVFRLAG